MTDKIVRNDEPPIKITSVTIGIPHRCPTCGFYPPDFYKLLEFPRRVDELYIVPKKSRHYSARADGTPYVYGPSKHSPEGLYPAIVVPKTYVGKVLLLREQEDSR